MQDTLSQKVECDMEIIFGITLAIANLIIEYIIIKLGL